MAGSMKLRPLNYVSGSREVIQILLQVVKSECTPQKTAKAAKVRAAVTPVPEPVLQDSDEDCVAYWTPSRDPAELQPKLK